MYSMSTLQIDIDLSEQGCSDNNIDPEQRQCMKKLNQYN